MERENNQAAGAARGNAPDIRRAQSTSFKTSLLGFDKEDVLGYIDRLVRDISEQKTNLEVTLNRLTDQNRDLIERVNRYEQRIGGLQADIEQERVYNQNAHEREELFKRAVTVLQEKVAFLQNNTVSPTGGSNPELEAQIRKANEIVLRLREELLRKDENITRLSEELSRRNEIIMNQDGMLNEKDDSAAEQGRVSDQQKRQLAQRAEEVSRLMEQIATLRARAEFLEEKRAEAMNALSEAKIRFQELLKKQLADRDALDRLGARLHAERAEIERFRKQMAEERGATQRLRAEQQAERNRLERDRAVFEEKRTEMEQRMAFADLPREPRRSRYESLYDDLFSGAYAGLYDAPADSRYGRGRPAETPYPPAHAPDPDGYGQSRYRRQTYEGGRSEYLPDYPGQRSRPYSESDIGRESFSEPVSYYQGRADLGSARPERPDGIDYDPPKRPGYARAAGGDPGADEGRFDREIRFDSAE